MSTRDDVIAYLRKLADQIEAGQVRPIELFLSRQPEEIPTPGPERRFRTARVGRVVIDLEWPDAMLAALEREP